MSIAQRRILAYKNFHFKKFTFKQPLRDYQVALIVFSAKCENDRSRQSQSTLILTM